MKEIWKPIKGYNGLYEISNLGKVKSFYRSKSGKILKTRLSICGYVFVILYRNKVGKPHYTHHLVWDYFGEKKRNGHKLQIDHIDENKLNNRMDNLQLMSCRENIAKLHKRMNKSSKYTGVHRDNVDDKWVSQIWVNGKKKYLGRFNSECAAHLAYQKELNDLHNL